MCIRDSSISVVRSTFSLLARNCLRSMFIILMFKVASEFFSFAILKAPFSWIDLIIALVTNDCNFGFNTSLWTIGTAMLSIFLYFTGLLLPSL